MFISEEQYIRKFNVYSKMVDFDSIRDNRERIKEKRKNEKIQLSIELVPKSSWFNNVRSNVKKSEWNRIRYVTYGLAEYKCEICDDRGNRHPVECHEVWDFNNSTKIQTLKGFISLCPLCHEVKHLGLARIRGNHDRAFSRFLELNNLSKHEGVKQFKFYKEEWKERSKVDWEIDLNILESYKLDVSDRIG
ncbi:hypothetical protein [Psychroflexus lacisalsi]|jgi:hypothetical protein|uniref:HNH endonuclease n=1 Tax=Psychroflexus lacisalsi TaxID=503928 RepID=A0ABP3VQL3_9FLAO|nr:hypothetical protein [Psychroflexus lacisalsi]MBZ9620131.1 hypothetical protein [Psychroflexus lacisalsi]